MRGRRLGMCSDVARGPRSARVRGIPDLLWIAGSVPRRRALLPTARLGVGDWASGAGTDRSAPGSAPLAWMWDVEVLDHEHQLCRLGWRRAPAQIGGHVISANPLTGMLSWDRLSFPEVFARHDEQFWSLQVRAVPRRMDVSASAVLEERAEERHFVLVRAENLVHVMRPSDIR